MADSPAKKSDGVVRVTVYTDGRPVNTTLFALISLHIHKEVNRIGRATLVYDAGNMPEGEVPESDDNSFAPGKKIRINAGYDDDEDPLFEGAVVGHRLVIGEGNVSSIRIECCDYAYSSTQVRKNRIFEKKKDSEAIRQILGEYPDLTTASVDSTPSTHNELVQYYCTDWDFILSRAEANGLIITTEQKEIRIKKPDVNAAAKLKVTYGTDLITFRGELAAEEQLSSLKAMAWDMSKQEVVAVEGARPALNKQGKDTTADLAKAVGNNKQQCQTDLCADKASLQAWADAQLLRTGLSRIQGSCKFTGNHRLLAGDLIELDGLGQRFNGYAFVGRVEHEIKEGEWFTTAGLGIPNTIITQKQDVMSPPAAGLLPGIQGLHIGKVVKMHSDPTNEYKVQVEIPVLNSDIKTVWARLSNFWSGNAYGAFFIPDVGDEVLLGFFNNDPCHAVILGSMYSSKQPSPYEPEKENNIRALLTRSKMKLEFQEKDKVITLETPGKNRIVISDKDKSITLEDQHNNKIEMNSDGIRIDSSKEIRLKAQTNILLEAGAGIRQHAKANIEMQGVNIEASAGAALTVKGNASAELSAAGQTVVKGAMVLIN